MEKKIERRIEKINSKYGFDTANEKVQIYESVNSDKIVKYLKEYFFTDSIIEMMNNGEILAIAYDDDGQEIVAQTISGDILKNILYDF